ncbi:hypothetical protein Tco_1117973 [Tanacetum coccineum]
MASHVWNILTNKESLWVRWIHAYNLKGRSFWDMPMLSNISWGWRKILQIHDCLRPNFWFVIGNGKHASVCTHCMWNWPTRWDVTHPALVNIQPHMLNEDQEDSLMWRMRSEQLKPFSVSRVWDDIRTRGEEVPWVNVSEKNAEIEGCVKKYAQVAARDQSYGITSSMELHRNLYPTQPKESSQVDSYGVVNA